MKIHFKTSNLVKDLKYVCGFGLRNSLQPYFRSFLFLFLVLISTISHAIPKPGDFITEGPKKENQIALTFDDGPGPNTEKFLDLLDQYQVKATFYVLGEQAKLRPSILKKIAERGHEIGSHTMTHMNYNKRYKYRLEKTTNKEKAESLTTDDLIKDMKNSKQIIEAAIGKKIKTLRMPYGIDRPWIKKAAHESGFILVNWTYGTDWNSTTAQQQIPGYVNALKPGAIILLHDGWPKSEKSLEITEAVLKAAKERKIKIIPASQLLGIDY